MRLLRVLSVGVPVLAMVVVASAPATATGSGGAVPRVGLAAAPVAAGYAMKDLGTLGGVSSAAVAVATSGYAVGWAQNSAGRRHAVRWDPAGVIRDLGTLGGLTSEALAVNDDDVVVGAADLPTGVRHAFAW